MSMRGMRGVSTLMVIWLAAGLGALGAREGLAQGESRGAGFVPLAEFLPGVAAARFEGLPRGAETRVRSAEAFAEMRRHILSLYEGVAVDRLHSFLLDGQHFDCLPIDQQPSVRGLGLTHVEVAPPPPLSTATEPVVPAPGEPAVGEPEEPRARATSPLTLGARDAFGNEIQCAEGTIPMRRVTLEEMTRFETLRQFFEKGPDGAGQVRLEEEKTAPAKPVHKYAHAYELVHNLGGSSLLNLWMPPINTRATQVFSLSQHWYTGGNPVQTVEGGWQAFPQKYNTVNSVLFIYWTADGYKRTGCYNLDCAAFVQTNSHWALGATFSHYSTPGGTQYEFQLQWQLSGGNWWLYLGGSGTPEAVGYYPTALYGNGQLANFATAIDYGGEVVGTTSWPQMGSGVAASRGFRHAAYQRQIFYADLFTATHWSTLSPTASPRSRGRGSCYSINFTPATAGSSWDSYFFFGGAGGGGC
ncbi:MAG TPA: neprosin family prolyl endopeptidase [Thermoanaerobaculia bacterium]|nr:neprosin family prolyl endopeptidase [Thermoanaerobaculia bacterium]